MLKVYTYKPSDLDLDRWPSGELRLEGSIQVTDPAEADVFICPGTLSMFQVNGIIQKDLIYKLPYLAGNEHRTAFLDVSDNFKTAIGMPCLFIKCDARSWMLKDDPNTIQMAWPVEDYAECVELPEGGFRYDVSAHMWTSTQTRIDSAQSCLYNPALKCDIALYRDFTGYLAADDPELARRRAEFRRSMRESRVALCPESIPGVLPYRFFEAMSAGRVPVLVSSDYVLPFADEIPYEEFTIFEERRNASSVGSHIQLSLTRLSDEELILAGKLARLHWLRLLNSADWPLTMTYAVEKKLREVLV